jgi:hypothetical protein
MQNDGCRKASLFRIRHFAFRIAHFAFCILTGASAFAAPPVVRITFNSADGLIEIPVRVNGVHASFLLDTAADYSVVDPRLVNGRQLPIEGGRAFADDVTIEVGGIRLEHQRVAVKANARDAARNVDGRLGHDLFARFVTRIDFTSRSIELWAPSAFRPPKAAVLVPLLPAGRLPAIAATIKVGDGRSLPARFVLDTGTAQSLVLHYAFANGNGLLDLPGARALPSQVPGDAPLSELPIDQVSLGGWTFDRPQVRGEREPAGSGPAAAADGAIGSGLLSRFRMTLDMARGRLWLEPKQRSGRM